jgi:uncharacterized membrane protein HdeD (DUF308 family)
MANAHVGFDLPPVNTEIRSKWGWFVALGVALLVLGFLAFGNLIAATVASVLYVGVLMAFGAIAQIVHAFQVKNWGGFFFWLLSGLLYGVAGVFAWLNPVLAAATLTLLLAIALILSGILRIWWSFQLKPEVGWGWVLASGIITLLAGIIFVLGWPVNSLWLLGMVLAIDLTFQGIAAIAFGLTLKGAH